MKPHSQSLRTRKVLSASIAASLLLNGAIPQAGAASLLWDGGGTDDNWSNPSNWGGVAPASNDLLFFGGSVRLTPNNDFAAGTIFNSLVFNSTAASFTLNGNSVLLTNGNHAGSVAVVGGSITNASPNAQTIALPLTLSQGQHYIASVAGSGQLNLSGPITRTPGATVGFIRSGGNINVTGSGLGTVNNTLGGWATVGGVSATDWATLDGSGNIIALPPASYTTVAGGGTIVSDPASNVRITSSGANVTLAAAGTTEINSLIGAATGANQVVDVGVGNTLRLGARGGILNATPGLGTTRIFTVGTTGQGTLTAGGADNTAGELFFCDTPFNSGSGNNLVINPVVTDNGSGVVSVHILGYVQFNNVVNTYSGGTFINQGRVQAGGTRIFGTGPVFVYNGGHIFLNSGNGTWTNDFFISGFGSPESGGIGAIRMGGNRTISGTITLMGTASTGNGTVTGRITGPGGLIVGSGSANGSGTYTLGSTAGPNDYAGDTQVNNVNPFPNAANTLRMNSATPNIMPHGVGKGNLILNGVSATVTATFDLNGTDQTINGLASIGSSANTIVINSSATAAALTVGDNDANASFAGSVRDGAGALRVTKIGAGTQGLIGANTYTGPTAVNTGKLVVGTAATGAGTFTVADNSALGIQVASPGTSLNMSSLTLGSSTTLEMDPGLFGNPTVAPVNVTGEITVNGAVSVNVTRAEVGTFTILQHGGVRNGTGSFVLGTLPPRTIGVLTDDLANQRVTLTITEVGGALTWVGVSGDWDISNPLNLTWKNTFSGIATFYKEDAIGNDTARFDDSATGTTTVNLTTRLSPNSVTVDNSTLNYTFNGTGQISGTNGLLKSGTGTLLLDNSGTNDFTGGLIINAGTVQVGNGNANGSLGTGSVANNGALIFARADNLTVASAISGSGSVTQNGAGILTLGGGNSFTGATVVAQGTLKAGTASALGTIDTGTTISSGATLDVNGQNFGTESVTVSGAGVDNNGAIINTGAQQLNAFRFVTLAGDTTLGGPGDFRAPGNPGRWDIRLTGGSASLLTGGVGHSLTKVGSNQIALVGVMVDPALGDITIKQGLLGFETSTSSMGDPFRLLTVEPGASLSFFNSTALWDKNIVLNGNGISPSITNWSGSNTIVGPIFLNGDCVIGVAGTALICNGVVSGTGSLIKYGNSPLTLAGTGDYTGTTTVSNGTLFVTGNLIGGGAVSVYGGTLGGVGVIGSAITIAPGGTLSPGTVANPIATIEAGGPVSLAGTNTMELNKTGGLLANDAIVFAPSIALGGTLRLTLTGEPLAAGDAFRLYEFGSASGAFANILPATPGPGLVWDISRLTIDGTLVVALPPKPGIASITLSGSEIVINGTNGTAGGTYHVLTSTDVALPLASWTAVSTNVFDASGNFNATNAVDLNTPQRFFLIQLPSP